MYRILIDKRVVKDLKKIDKNKRLKIIDAIENKIAYDPYKGKRLAGNLSDFWRYRVGDYRIIYLIFEDRVEVEIVKAGHRKDIYK